MNRKAEEESHTCCCMAPNNKRDNAAVDIKHAPAGPGRPPNGFTGVTTKQAAKTGLGKIGP
jgi:hypothetical protein